MDVQEEAPTEKCITNCIYVISKASTGLLYIEIVTEIIVDIRAHNGQFVSK